MASDSTKPFLDEAPADMPKETKETSWKSIYIAGCCSFVQAMQFSIFFSSQYPYLLTLDHTINPSDFGFVVATYSIAQSIASPGFGYWSGKLGEVSLPLKVGFLFMAVGNILYIGLAYLPSHYLAAMFVARAVAGAGTGNMSLLRAYASSASTSKDRSRAIAIIVGGIAVGTMIGPGMQTIFTPLGKDGVDFLGFNINIYNSPAILSFIMDFIGFCVVEFAFVEEYLIDVSKTSSDGEEKPSLAKPCAIALAVCVTTRFLQIFVHTSTETIGSAYSMMMFSFESDESVAVNAMVHTIAGALAAALFIVFIVFDISKYMRMRTFCMGALVMGLGMYISTYPFPFYTENVLLSVNGSEANCDPTKYDWCNSLTRVSSWLYYPLYIINFGIGNSFLNISVTTMYSKVVGPRPQGTYQGFYQMAGSFGRLTSPILISLIYSLYGPRATWLINIGLIFFTLMLWIFFRQHMVPFEKSRKRSVRAQPEIEVDTL